MLKKGKDSAPAANNQKIAMSEYTQEKCDIIEVPAIKISRPVYTQGPGQLSEQPTAHVPQHIPAVASQQLQFDDRRKHLL